MKKLRFRNIFVMAGSFLVLLLWILTDPSLGLIENMEYGASTLAMLTILLKSVLYVGVLHYSRKALIDYLDFRIYLEKAGNTSTGAGLALVSVGLIMISISLVIYAATSS